MLLTFLLTHIFSHVSICHLGASSDMETATKIATAMVISYGMSEKVHKLMFLHFAYGDCNDIQNFVIQYY